MPRKLQECRRSIQFIFDYEDTERCTVEFFERYYADGGGFDILVQDGGGGLPVNKGYTLRQPTYSAAKEIALKFINNE